MSRANKRFDPRLAHSLIKFVNKQSGANKNNSKAKKKRFYAFNESTLDKIMNHVNLEFVKSVLVIGDAGLQVVDRLVNAGITDITVALARLDRAAKYYEPLVYSINRYINYYFSIANITITHFEELTSMNKKKFDLIIANPPYGSIGANITKTVIDNLDFDQYINLLPANDYKRNSTHDLFNYQSGMFTVIDGFDAAVTTHCAEIHKTKVNNLTLAEFEISQYTDKQLDKYFMLNYNRKHYAIDACNISGTFINTLAEQDIDTVLLISCRTLGNKHLPYSKNVDTYRWNVLKNISLQELVESRKESCHGQLTGRIKIGSVRFKTAAEKDNISKFLYSNSGFRFISKICTSMNLDGSTNLGKVFPKVDWTRSWTVEEILRDYDYTEEEIKEVMDDLKNYKGMND